MAIGLNNPSAIDSGSNTGKNIGGITGSGALGAGLGTLLGDAGGLSANLLTDLFTKPTDTFTKLPIMQILAGGKGGLESIWNYILYGDKNKTANDKQEAEDKEKNKYLAEKEAMELAGLNPYSMFAGGNMMDNGNDKSKDMDKILMLLLASLIRKA